MAVVVFDFDHTIIDDNSDTWVVEELGLTDLFNQLRRTMPWTSLMGLVIKQIQASISESGKKKMIYLGDGGGDYCPSLKLGVGDHVMPRKDFPLWRRICSNQMLVKAEVHEWSNGEELERTLLQLIKTKSLEGNS